MQAIDFLIDFSGYISGNKIHLKYRAEALN